MANWVSQMQHINIFKATTVTIYSDRKKEEC